MTEQHEVLAKVIVPGAQPLVNGRHEAFAQSCLSMSQADAYREHYPASRRWKPPSVQCEASKLHTKVLQRVQWLKAQAASEEIISLIEVKKLVSAIIRDTGEPTLARLAAVDRMVRIERWDTAESTNKQTMVVFNMRDDKGRPLL